MKKCPKCNFENQDNIQFCQNCGTPLSAQTHTQSVSPQNKGKWYQRTAFTVIMLILFFPVGLVLMWVYRKNWKMAVKVIISVLCVIIIFPSVFGDDSDSQNGNVAVSEDRGETQEDSQDNNEPESPLESEIEQFNSGEYAYISNDDLSTYAVNMPGEKVYVLTQVDDMKDGRIQSTLDDGFMMSNFNVGDNYDKYSELISVDDVIAIAGTVSETTDYSIAGKSVDLNDCIVFAIGDDSEKYRKESTDESLSQYLVVTDDVANTENDISEEDYKNLCQQLNYEDILRNPDSYDETYCVLSGTVDQIIEGWFDTYAIYVMDSSGNRWECLYMYKDGEPHLLEGDSVTVYGHCNGTTTATTLLGEQVTLPYVDAEYID